MRTAQRASLSILLACIFVLLPLGCDWFPNTPIQNKPDVFLDKYEISTRVTDVPKHLSFAWAGSEWGMAWTTIQSNNIYFIRFSNKGKSDGTDDPLKWNDVNITGTNPSIVWGVDYFLLAYKKASDYTVHFTKISRDGIVLYDSEALDPADSVLSSNAGGSLNLEVSDNYYMLMKADVTINAYVFEKTKIDINDFKAYSSNQVDFIAQSNYSPCTASNGAEFLVVRKADSGSFEYEFFNEDGTPKTKTLVIPPEITADRFNIIYSDGTGYYLAGMSKTLERLTLWQLGMDGSSVRKITSVKCEDPPVFFTLGYDGKDFSFLWLEEGKGNIYFSN